MSHFSVIVIGDDVAKQLAPYHEYECTGEDDEYVIDVDVTDELNAQLDKEGEYVRKPDGTLTSKYASEFYTKESEDEFDRKLNQKLFELPAGCEIVSMTERAFLEATDGSIAEFAKDYGGYIERDGRFFKHTNPNAEWDWYSIGGRWTGWLKLKARATGKHGETGLMTDPGKSGTADIMRKGDIDFAGMMDEAGQEAGALWDKCRSITPDLWESWESVRERVKPIDAARDFYGQQIAIAALRDSKDKDFSWEVDDTLALSRDQFIEGKRNRAFIPYAIVQDGKWIAKGEMGWWGISDDKVEQKEWNAKVSEMLMALPDDTTITVVDCHI